MWKCRMLFFGIVVIMGLIAGLIAHLAIGKPCYLESILSLVGTLVLVERYLL